MESLTFVDGNNNVACNHASGHNLVDVVHRRTYSLSGMQTCIGVLSDAKALGAPYWFWWHVRTCYTTAPAPGCRAGHFRKASSYGSCND